MLTTLPNKVWRLAKSKTLKLNTSRFFSTRGCGSAVPVIRNFVADNTTCLLLCLILSLIYFGFPSFPFYLLVPIIKLGNLLSA